MDILTAIESEPLAKIQDIALLNEIAFDSGWLAYDALNKALECKRKDVAKWFIKFYKEKNVSNENSSIHDRTPLHNAVKLGDLEIIRMLLQKKASLVAVDSDNNTALHIAFLHRYDQITDLLLGYLVKSSNFTDVKNNQGLSHIHIASTRNNVKAIRGFLKDDTNADSPLSWIGYSALHFAIEFNLLEAAKTSVAADGEMELVKRNESTMSPIQSLRQHQVESMVIPYHRGKCTFPYFHLACLKESVSVVKDFIDRRADLNETIIWGAPHCHHYSPLQCATESPYDREEKVRLLLQHGAVVKQVKCIYNRKHMTALHLAFYEEYQMCNEDLDSTIVDSLYRALKDKEENIDDENNLSYFHIAVSRNDIDMVQMYLDKGADVNHSVQCNNHGFSGYTPLLIAVKYELMDMAQLLIERGAIVNVGQDNEYHTYLWKPLHETPLSKAVETENLEMIKLLIQCGAMIQDDLLHHAVAAGNPEMVQYLVDLGWNVNGHDYLGQSPIIVSLNTDSPCKKIIEILLKAGAFVDADIDSTELSTLDSGTFLNEDVEKFEIYKIIFEEASNAGECKDFTCFQLLVNGNEKDIKMLLQTNVDFSVTDFHGKTLIHTFAKNFNPGVLEQLRGQRFDVNARDWFDNTPLMDATEYGNVIAVQCLLDLGADVEAVNQDNETALYKSLLVDSKGGKECVQVLLEHGANAQIETMSLYPTIFNVILEMNRYSEGELLLAHLALQELDGTVITEPIQKEIKSYDQFKSYFEYCKQLLSGEMYPLVTVFDVLTSSQRKLECYLKNEELASKLKNFQTVEYFDAMLTRRLSKVIKIVGLREAAKPIISKLLNADYNRIPSIVDDILSYFVQEDIEYLISIENELQLDSCISNNVSN